MSKKERKRTGLNDGRVEVDENDENKRTFAFGQGEAIISIHIREGDTYLYIPYSHKDKETGKEYTTGEDFLRLYFGLVVSANKVKGLIQSRTDLSDQEFEALAAAAVMEEDYFDLSGFDPGNGIVH